MIKHLTEAVFFLGMFLLLSPWAQGSDVIGVTEVKDVETLNDDIMKYSGLVVRVKGRVEDKIDSRSIVLESGGIFNDEIVVIGGPNAKGANIGALEEDIPVVVTGTVIVKPAADFQKEYNLILNPKLAGDFSDTKVFLVASEITMVKKVK